jgi:hypothetical protein
MILFNRFELPATPCMHLESFSKVSQLNKPDVNKITNIYNHENYEVIVNCWVQYWILLDKHATQNQYWMRS